MRINSMKLLKLLKYAICIQCCFMAALPLAFGQTFNSGSNGSDGPLDLTSTPSGTTVVFDPTIYSGNQHNLHVFNFTYITIPIGVTLRLSATKVSGPVYWLASGDVNIGGTVDLRGQSAIAPSANLDGRRRSLDAGAGGYAGGVGGKADTASTANEPVAQAGDGPGGGVPSIAICPGAPQASPGAGGKFSGNSFLVPLIGGSGGGGGMYLGNLGATVYGPSGGAGGGALLIASSGTVSVNGQINASGGDGAGNMNGSGSCGGVAWSTGTSGGGSGGGIRIAATALTGNGQITAVGGNDPDANGSFPLNFCGQTCKGVSGGGGGVVRIEVFNDTFTGGIQVSGFGGSQDGVQSVGSPFATGIPAGVPSVTVVSVDSTVLPGTLTGNLATPDASINTGSASTITVQASQIPVGTILTLHVFSDNNTDQTVQTTPLAGTLQNSQATATVTFPSGYSLNYVKATWTASN